VTADEPLLVREGVALSRTAGALHVLGGAVLGGTSGFVATLLMRRGAAPDLIGTLRVLIGGVGLLVLVVRVESVAALRGLVTPAVLVAGVGIMTFQLAFFRAVQLTGLSLSTVITSGLQPILTAAAGAVVLREILHRRWYPATAACVLGITVLMISRSEVTTDLRGVLLAGAAGAGFTLFTVGSKRMLRQGHSPLAVSAVALAIASVVLAPRLLRAELGWLQHPEAVGLTLYLGIGTVGLSYLLYTRGLSAVKAGTAATLALAEPMTGVLLGVLALGEDFGATALGGTVLVLAGLVLLVREPRTRKGRGRWPIIRS
jgi:drug/metabolite transporter, DME family